MFPSFWRGKAAERADGLNPHVLIGRVGGEFGQRGLMCGVKSQQLDGLAAAGRIQRVVVRQFGGLAEDGLARLLLLRGRWLQHGREIRAASRQSLGKRQQRGALQLGVLAVGGDVENRLQDLLRGALGGAGSSERDQFPPQLDLFGVSHSAGPRRVGEHARQQLSSALAGCDRDGPARPDVARVGQQNLRQRGDFLIALDRR